MQNRVLHYVLYYYYIWFTIELFMMTLTVLYSFLSSSKARKWIILTKKAQINVYKEIKMKIYRGWENISSHFSTSITIINNDKAFVACFVLRHHPSSFYFCDTSFLGLNFRVEANLFRAEFEIHFAFFHFNLRLF